MRRGGGRFKSLRRGLVAAAAVWLGLWVGLVLKGELTFYSPFLGELASFYGSGAGRLEDTTMLQRSLALNARSGHLQRVQRTIGAGIEDGKPGFADDVGYHDLKRNYTTSPIVLRDKPAVYPCPIPCMARWEDAEADVLFNMENVYSGPFFGRLWGTTNLSSPVPTPYFSWREYGFLEPAPGYYERGPGAGVAMAVVLVSNCGGVAHYGGNDEGQEWEMQFQAKIRLDLVKELEQHGVTVDKLGLCYGHSFRGSKIELLRKYRFYLAFENSRGKDYASEKLFQSFVAGAIPIYLPGADEAAFFAPDSSPHPYQSHAMINVDDYPTTKELAQMILSINANKGAWESFTRFKREGYTVDFKALVDLADRHSRCRACIAYADGLTRRFGATTWEEPLRGQSLRLLDGRAGSSESVHDESRGSGGGGGGSTRQKTFLIRERGEFVFTRSAVVDEHESPYKYGNGNGNGNGNDDNEVDYDNTEYGNDDGTGKEGGGMATATGPLAHRRSEKEERHQSRGLYESLLNTILCDLRPYRKNRGSSELFSAKGGHAVWAVYTLPDKNVLLSDEDVQELKDETRLEVIFV